MTPSELAIMTRLLDCVRRFRAPYRDTAHLALRLIEGAGVLSGQHRKMLQLTRRCPRAVVTSRGRDIESWRLTMPRKGITVIGPCAQCGAIISQAAHEVARGTRVLCHACVIGSAEITASVLARTSVGACGCCRVWNGYRTTNGYGIVGIAGARYLVHRLVWEFDNGPIPDGLYACHNCPCGDRRECCEPSHLFLGTSQDNMLDAARKGRTLSGERNHQAKLTSEAVREIRQRIAKGETGRSLAREFGVSQKTLRLAANGTNWRRVGATS